MRTVVLALLIAIILFHAAVLVTGWSAFAKGEPGGFAVFYSTAKIARIAGFSQLYDRATQNHFHPASMNSGGYFYHLPYEAVLLLPLSYLSQNSAFFLWTMLNLGSIVAGGLIVRRSFPSIPFWAGLAFAPVLAMCVNGQDSGILFLLAALSWREFANGKEFRAAGFLAIGLFKFQFVIPLAAILAARSRKFAAGFILASAALLALSWALVGSSGVQAYYQLLHNHGEETNAMMANLRGLINSASRAQHPFLILAASALVALLAVIRLTGPEEIFAGAIMVAQLVSYHGHFYDVLLLAIPIALAIERAQSWSAKWPAAIVLLSSLFLMRPGWLYLLALPFLALLASFLVHRSESTDSSLTRLG